ncbi:MAG: hypothetical protein Q8N51_01270 [Gammaproteobacteria bacterium]|nr:hypothetical protein [Gammaproteobacteria bacterium]
MVLFHLPWQVGTINPAPDSRVQLPPHEVWEPFQYVLGDAVCVTLDKDRTAAVGHFLPGSRYNPDLRLLGV